jgi:hydroxybutyrate-dimer hydrolase
MEVAMFQRCLSAISVTLWISTFGGAPAEARDKFVPPATVAHAFYDGNKSDLLTAGLGKSGLGNAEPPRSGQPPNAEELRRSAIYNNYRALVDPTKNGGYGVLYGPNVGIDGVPTDSEGKIAGDEYIAFAHDARGRKKVTMMVQLPSQFDPAKACIITAPSSGSRGIYGAIATGEWGLKHGCAVAYTDKGTGTGAHDLQANTVNLIHGERADAAGENSNFTAALTAAERTAFNAATPNRFAFKHAHSQQNPEKDWGENVLESIRFAFHILQQKYGPQINKRSTIVIASSVSNGGGASLRALEADREGLIDGLAVAEPNVTPARTRRFSIRQDGRRPFTAHSRPLLDYTTLINVYQACANMAPKNATPSNPEKDTARCASLKAKGLLTATTPMEQAREAQRIINNYGILPEQNLVQPGHWAFSVPQAISVTYANAYGRFSVADNLCAFSFGVRDAKILPLDPETEATIFGWSSAIPPVAPRLLAPPTSRVALINNAAPNGPTESGKSTPDQNLDGALCLRSLAAGNAGRAGRRRQAERVARGVAQVRASGDLHGIPAIIVTGRNDAVIAPNHASRAYFGLNKMVEGRRSRLRYYEVTNAQHLDVFNALPMFSDYAKRYVPLHYYFMQALDLMYDRLRKGRPLPPSQLVRTHPRGDAAPPISVNNVPPISDTPPPGDRITFGAEQVRIPN